MKNDDIYDEKDLLRQIWQLQAQKVPVRQIAAQLGISTGKIYRLREKYSGSGAEDSSSNDFRLVQEFNPLRLFLHRYFMYSISAGYTCKKLGISETSFKNLRTIIHSFIDRERQRAESRNSSRQLFETIITDPNQFPRNLLVNAYFLHSFDQEDIKLYFRLMRLWQGKNIWLSEEFVSENEKSYQNRLLKYLLPVGYIVRKKGRPNSYQLSPDILRIMSKQELIELYNAIMFYAEVGLLGVPAYTLSDTLTLYLRYKYHTELVQKTLFIYRHTLPGAILDDELISELLGHIEKRNTIEVVRNYGKRSISGIPLKIVTEYSYNRQFVLLQTSKNEQQLCKVSEIKKVCLAAEPMLNNLLDANNIFTDSWNIALNNGKRKLVEIEFNFMERPYRLKRLQQEGLSRQNSSIQQLTGPYHILYRIAVTDPLEMLPWILSFDQDAYVLPNKAHKLQEKIIRHWEEAWHNYDHL